MSFPRYERYKDSGVAWLGEVPEHWRLLPLWTFFRRDKRTDFPDEELLSVYREYGVVRKSDRDDNYNNPSDDLSAYQLVDADDLVVNKMKAWQGSVAISPYRGIVSPAYFVYRPHHHESPKFLHYLMRSAGYIAGYLSLSKGIRIGQWDLDPIYHSRMAILLPPKDEQEQIAGLLDHETAKIDALIEEQRRLIALLKEKRQAVISHAVTKGLNPSAAMKDSGVAWMGDTPSHWDIKRLRFVVCLITDRPDEASQDVVALENIEGWTGRFIETDTTFDGEGIHFQAGDLLFGKLRPYLAKVLVARQSGDAVGDFHVLRPRAEGRSEYLKYLFLTPPFISLLNSSTVGAKMPRVGWPFMADVQIPVPSPSEQGQIVKFLDRDTAKIDAVIHETTHAIRVLQERRSALISAAVTGKIDVRGLAANTFGLPEAAYEPA